MERQQCPVREAGGVPNFLWSLACLFLVLIDEERLFFIQNHFFADNHFFNIFASGNFEHDIEHGFFQNRSQATGSRLATYRLFCNRTNGAIGKFQFDIFKLKQLFILLGEGIFGSCQYLHQSFFVQLLQSRHHGKSSHKLGDQAVFKQVFGLHLFQNGLIVFLLFGNDLLTEAHGFFAGAGADDGAKPDKCATANEQDIGGVDL